MIAPDMQRTCYTVTTWFTCRQNLGGLQIIDVSDVTAPKLLGAVETKFALGLDMDENYIYLADEDEGITDHIHTGILK